MSAVVAASSTDHSDDEGSSAVGTAGSEATHCAEAVAKSEPLSPSMILTAAQHDTQKGVLQSSTPQDFSRPIVDASINERHGRSTENGIADDRPMLDTSGDAVGDTWFTREPANGCYSSTMGRVGGSAESLFGRLASGELSKIKDHGVAPPLPQELLKLMTELATTGSSSWLPWWDEDDHLYRTNNNSNGDHQKPEQIAGQPSQNKDPSSARHHQYRASGNIRTSRKRARVSSSHSRRTLGMKHKQLHRPFFSSGGGVGTKTTTTTIAVERGCDSVALAATASRPGQRTVSGQTNIAAASSAHSFYPPGSQRLADSTASSGGQKRSLILIRNQPSALNPPASIFSPGSVGSGRTSGSEHEDTSQYECDSEGTSATSNSELSFDRCSDRGHSSTSVGHPSFRRRRGFALQNGVGGGLSRTVARKGVSGEPTYSSLKEAVHSALSLVLDHFHKNRGGYKLSPTELLVNNVVSNSKRKSVDADSDAKPSAPDATTDNGDQRDKRVLSRDEILKEGELGASLAGNCVGVVMPGNLQPLEELVFRRRKQRLLDMLGQFCGSDYKPAASSDVSSATDSKKIGPPFTIQRVAEILVEPERYYSQTHKLCNCLEKLLLVTSTTSAFGGSRGGDTSQNFREETELAALSEEKGRLRSEFRQSHRRPRRKAWSPSSDDADLTRGENQEKEESSPGGHYSLAMSAEGRGCSGADEDDDETQHHGLAAVDEAVSRELLEAAARASLRTKFDHVGIDPHSSAAVHSREVCAMAESRGMTNSPPPPSLGMAANAGIILPGGHGGLLRQHNHGSPTSPNSPERDHPSMARAPSPILFSSVGGDGSHPPMGAIHTNLANTMHHSAAMVGVSPNQILSSNATVNYGSASVFGQAPGFSHKDMDIESRSSASSDVDSESDVSFDDSASDRSDGSDSGQHYEPLTAARAMALNRMHQQQRLQSRVFTSLHMHSGGAEGFRPPADSEYQSGDSIDSMRAEDSGGSDSSSSDVAD